MDGNRKGGFTLPGEAGYEALTLKLADKWGADVIRDSDGTKLSDEILNSGYGIYSTVCLIRQHNDWASRNKDKLQQTFLSTVPRIADNEIVTIHLMDDFFEEQFAVNDSDEAMPYWQVMDRTSNQELSGCHWTYDRESGNVTIQNASPFHRYSVSFLAYRIWEEISMYNHTTNNWDKEHLMQIDPRHPEAQKYMKEWMESWCLDCPDTTVVRFTSMFYNFVWMWGSSERNRHLFTDWASYDFTVSPLALKEFEKKYGYELKAEDFVNKGHYHVTHMPADKKKRDYMEFINDFVISFGKKLVEIVHKYGKQAYVFYDDSWVGIEPYNGRFEEFGFDGMIKCVFSGYEARLCAGVPVKTHELRLHPYLFPVGLGGAPTFLPGGNPTLDAKRYWIQVRRALLREKIDRIGLGGYLHLVEDFPDFCDYIELIADEFRTIKGFHESGKPYVLPLKIAVLHSWGKLRSWTLSGHFHETYMHDLIHVNEALSGLPVDVDYIDFADVKAGKLKNYQVVVNAGRAGDAWSGADAWNDDEVVEALTKWVYKGGVFFGIGQPSAVEGYDTFFRMAHVLGVDLDIPARVCHGKWKFETEPVEGLIPKEADISGEVRVSLTDGAARVLAAEDVHLQAVVNDFGKGKGVYLTGFEFSYPNVHLLMNLMLYGAGRDIQQNYTTDNLYTECAYYPESKCMVVINNSDSAQSTRVKTPEGMAEIELAAFETKIV